MLRGEGDDYTERYPANLRRATEVLRERLRGAGSVKGNGDEVALLGRSPARRANEANPARTCLCYCPSRFGEISSSAYTFI